MRTTLSPGKGLSIPVKSILVKFRLVNRILDGMGRGGDVPSSRKQRMFGGAGFYSSLSVPVDSQYFRSMWWVRFVPPAFCQTQRTGRL